MDSSHPHTRLRTVPNKVWCWTTGSLWVFTRWRMCSPGSFGTVLHFFRAFFVRLAWCSVLPSETFFNSSGPTGTFKIQNISVGWRATSCSRDPSAPGASSLFHITELRGGRFQGSIRITNSDWGQDTSIHLLRCVATKLDVEPDVSPLSPPSWSLHLVQTIPMLLVLLQKLPDHWTHKRSQNNCGI